MLEPAEKMTRLELTATCSIAGLFALRLLGLFMVLPLLSLYAHDLTNATPNLIGIAVGCYGLTQALFQIPFGSLSDRYDRKAIISIGLIIFMLGSLISAYASSIEVLIVGRALQGVGAVGSSTIALLTDYTRESQRTKAMAILGAAIGISFIAALILGPLLSSQFQVPSLFKLAALFGMICLAILYTLPKQQYQQTVTTQPIIKQLAIVLSHGQLLMVNMGILLLHAIFTCCFVVLPVILHDKFTITAAEQWQIYLPSLIASCLFILPLLKRTTSDAQTRHITYLMLVLLILSLLWLWRIHAAYIDIIIGLSLFFSAFNFLEASLPAQISRLAPADSKGTTMGVYSCSQFFGIFVGGAMGGWLYGRFDPSVVFLFCAMLATLWIFITFLVNRSKYDG